MSTGSISNPVGTNGTLNAAGSGGITNAPLYGTWLQQAGDPFHLFPSPTADNSAPAVLPNLGAKSMMPLKPYGAFVAPKVSGGGFNAMAARGAGPLFNPGIGAPKWPTQSISPPGVKPTTVGPQSNISPDLLKLLIASPISGLGGPL